VAAAGADAKGFHGLVSIQDALKNREKSTMLCSGHCAVLLLGLHALRRVMRGAISLMISTKNWQECGVWVALALGSGTAGRAHAPRWRKSTDLMCDSSIGRDTSMAGPIG
jgi:hypothetical protein